MAVPIKELGYKDEIGCQSFLYPNETETRKLLVFVVENLPRENDIGDKIDVMLSKLAENTKTESPEEDSFSNVIEIEGIRFPNAVDINALPKGLIFKFHPLKFTFHAFY